MLHSQIFTRSNPNVDRCSNPLPWDSDSLSSPETYASRDGVPQVNAARSFNPRACFSSPGFAAPGFRAPPKYERQPVRAPWHARQAVRVYVYIYIYIIIIIIIMMIIIIICIYNVYTIIYIYIYIYIYINNMICSEGGR